jgi:hypothetical protein
VAAPSILILCGDSDHDLGDRAILQATCQELRAARADVKLTVLSRDAEGAARDFGAAAIRPGWRGLPRLCCATAASDLVRVAVAGYSKR